MRGKGRRASLRWIAAAALIPMLGTGLAVAPPAQAQFSQSYNFLKAVRDRDGQKVTDLVGKPGSTIVNAKDYNTGETALHIVTAGRDAQWMRFLLAKGADPNARNRDGQTPLALAALLGWVDGAQLLLAEGADVNATNDRGETPLIIAVQRRDLPTVRLLLSNGADPSIADHIAGMSARDYAKQDSRGAAVLRLIEEIKPVKRAPVQGPRMP